MLAYYIPLFLSSTLAIAINSSPAPPPTRITSPFSSLTARLPPVCATESLQDRQNVRAIDCVALASFILATTNHAQVTQFWAKPDVLNIWFRTSGTCEILIHFPYPAGSSGPVPEWSSFDEIVGAALEIVATCLLDNKPTDRTHWGGGSKVGAEGKLTVGVTGLRVGEGGVGSGNGTLSLNDRPTGHCK